MELLHARTAIDKLLDLLGIDRAMQSDPVLIAQVLNKDMLLEGFAPAQELLAPALSAPVDLAPMFDKTINAIMTKQPAIQEFIMRSLEENLITKVESEKGKAEILRSVHHMYVLNELTKSIVADIEFTTGIQEYLIEAREQFGISKDFICALETLKGVYKGSMFEPTKIIGMDMVYRARANDRMRGYLTVESEQAQIDGLRLNIQEASITDLHAGYTDNAIVGGVLAKISPSAVTLTHDENRVMLFHLSRRWVSLYETWNIAFCIGNLAYMSVLLPKLFAPEVIDATPERFLITRSAALWCSTLFHQFATLRGRENVVIPHAKEIAQLWGGINREYAAELALEEDCHNLDYYQGMLDITMGEIMDAMKDSLFDSHLSDEQIERINNVYR